MSQAEQPKMSPAQEWILRAPEHCDLFLGGGRGGGKSYTMALLAIRHGAQYGKDARVLYIRQTYRGLADFEQVMLSLLTEIYGKHFRYNAAEHIFRLSNGAIIELGQMEGPKDYLKYQGRTFNLIMVDEAGQYQDPQFIDMLRSNLRGPKNMPLRMVLAANPGGVGHTWLAQRYVFVKGMEPWKPFHEKHSGKEWIYCPLTYKDNIFLDQDNYEQSLVSSCPFDSELLQAWLEGRWDICRGAFFGQVLDMDRNATAPWEKLPDVLWGHSNPWKPYIAMDYGSSAPAVVYIVARSPGCEGPDGRYYPRDSRILLDELATNQPGQLSEGLGWTIPQLAEAICELCEKWGVKPDGVADDACFSQHGHGAGSIANEFKRYKVHLRPAKKGDRVSGWAKMRRMLADAGKPDVPGLYISRNCEYFWQSVPGLARDPKRVEDLDTRQADHAADACRYALTYEKPEIRPFSPMG